MRKLSLACILVCGVASADTLTGRVVAVTDGDTLTLLTDGNKRLRVRLADIDAPERKQRFGGKSRQSLADLCLKKPVEVVTRARDEYKRFIATVNCSGVDAASEQVARGMAWVSARQTSASTPLYELETVARLRQVGLWADAEPVPPWEWRAKQVTR